MKSKLLPNTLLTLALLQLTASLILMKLRLSGAGRLWAGPPVDQGEGTKYFHFITFHQFRRWSIAMLIYSYHLCHHPPLSQRGHTPENTNFKPFNMNRWIIFFGLESGGGSSRHRICFGDFRELRTCRLARCFCLNSLQLNLQWSYTTCKASFPWFNLEKWKVTGCISPSVRSGLGSSAQTDQLDWPA